MRFERRIEVKAGVAEVWEFLWDIKRLARCVPGCQEVRELEPQRRYSLVLEERVGPFKAHFDMDVIVQECEPERMVRLQAKGSDRKLGAFNQVGLEVKLDPSTERGGENGTRRSARAWFGPRVRRALSLREQVTAIASRSFAPTARQPW